MLNKKLLLADKELQFSDAQMKLMEQQGILIGKQGEQIDFNIGDDDAYWQEISRKLNAWDYIVGCGRDLLSLVGTFMGGSYEDTYTDTVHEYDMRGKRVRTSTSTTKKKKKRKK